MCAGAEFYAGHAARRAWNSPRRTLLLTSNDDGICFVASGRSGVLTFAHPQGRTAHFSSAAVDADEACGDGAGAVDTGGVRVRVAAGQVRAGQMLKMGIRLEAASFGRSMHLECSADRIGRTASTSR